MELSRNLLGSERAIALVLGLVLVVLGSGCSAGSDVPDELSDGSRTPEPPGALDGVDRPVVLSRARAVDVARGRLLPQLVAACRDAWHGTPSDLAVLRTGVAGTSVTLRASSHKALLACDGARDSHNRSCGTAYGRVRAERLLDPRLDLVPCPPEGGRRLAFAWIEPAPRARFVVLRQDGFAEAYPTMGALPVRVATASGMDVDRSAAAFEVTEHDRLGRLLRSYVLRASVAG